MMKNVSGINNEESNIRTNVVNKWWENETWSTDESRWWPVYSPVRGRHAAKTRYPSKSPHIERDRWRGVERRTVIWASKETDRERQTESGKKIERQTHYICALFSQLMVNIWLFTGDQLREQTAWENNNWNKWINSDKREQERMRDTCSITQQKGGGCNIQLKFLHKNKTNNWKAWEVKIL